MNSDFNSNFNPKSNLSIQEVHIDIQDVEEQQNSNQSYLG
jgi:hypothetical protein